MARKRSLKKLLEILHKQVPLLVERYGVEKLEVFGSHVRQEQTKDSDLDVLVTSKEAPSLLTFIALENYLSDLLGVKVDLVTQDSLKPKISQRVLNEAITLEPITKQHLRGLRGSLKGKGILKALVEERRKDREREDSKIG